MRIYGTNKLLLWEQVIFFPWRWEFICTNSTHCSMGAAVTFILHWIFESQKSFFAFQATELTAVIIPITYDFLGRIRITFWKVCLFISIFWKTLFANTVALQGPLLTNLHLICLPVYLACIPSNLPDDLVFMFCWKFSTWWWNNHVEKMHRQKSIDLTTVKPKLFPLS
jgi:hypothetical protein